MGKPNMATSVDSPSLFYGQFSGSLQRIQDVLTVLGVIYGVKLTLGALKLLVEGVRTFILPRIFRKNLVTIYGSWAAVTGCTDGIGKAFCEELAERGFNLVLIGRNIDKLQMLSKDLVDSFMIETRIIQADFSEGRVIYAHVAAELQDVDLGLLVNNVGICLEYPMSFENVSEEVIWQHVNINVGGMTMMTSLVLPGMVKRGRGAIINLSSSAALRPLPLMSIYSASKIYVDYFSRAIQFEYKQKGIFVQSLIPFYIRTQMTKYSSTLQGAAGFWVPSATTYARSAIATIGTSSRTTGYWPHGIQYLMASSIPENVYIFGSWLLQLFLRNSSMNMPRSPSHEHIISKST